MNPERYALMMECARTIRNRYCILRQVSSPGWLPRAKDEKRWKLTALKCIENRFDPSEYVEALFRHAKPFPLVIHLHSKKAIDNYRAIKTGETPRHVSAAMTGLRRKTSAEWERQTTYEMDFINSRINTYGAEVGLRIAMADPCETSPAVKALMSRLTGYRLTRNEARQAYAILTSELAGPAYGRKFGLLLGSDVLEETVTNMETEYGFGSQ